MPFSLLENENVSTTPPDAPLMITAETKREAEEKTDGDGQTVTVPVSQTGTTASHRDGPTSDNRNSQRPHPALGAGNRRQAAGRVAAGVSLRAPLDRTRHVHLSDLTGYALPRRNCRTPGQPTFSLYLWHLAAEFRQPNSSCSIRSSCGRHSSPDTRSPPPRTPTPSGSSSSAAVP